MKKFTDTEELMTWLGLILIATGIGTAINGARLKREGDHRHVRPQIIGAGIVQIFVGVTHLIIGAHLF